MRMGRISGAYLFGARVGAQLRPLIAGSSCGAMGLFAVPSRRGAEGAVPMAMGSPELQLDRTPHPRANSEDLARLIEGGADSGFARPLTVAPAGADRRGA